MADWTRAAKEGEDGLTRKERINNVDGALKHLAKDGGRYGYEQEKVTPGVTFRPPDNSAIYGGYDVTVEAKRPLNPDPPANNLSDYRLKLDEREYRGRRNGKVHGTSGWFSSKMQRWLDTRAFTNIKHWRNGFDKMKQRISSEEEIEYTPSLLQNEGNESYDTISEVPRSDDEEQGRTKSEASGHGDLEVTRAVIAELVVCILAFIGRGFCLNSVGPTLIDLRQIANMSVPQSAGIFASQSVGFLIGSIAAKPLLQRFNNQMVMAICLFIQAGSTALIPAFRSIAAMCTMFIGQGFAIGVVGIGVCAACIRLGGKSRNGMFLQSVYFGVSMGSVLGPFIAKPFLSHLAKNTDNHELESSPEISNVITDHLQGNLNPSSTLLPNVTVTTLLPDLTFSETRVHIFYLIIGLILCIPAFLFMLLFGTRDKTKSYTKQQENKHSESLAFSVCTLPLFVAISATFTQCLLYFGIQDSYSNLLTTFAVLGPLKLTKPMGVYLTSLFWASMAIGRLNGIWIAKLISPFKILVVDFSAAFVASFFLVVFGAKYNVALWFLTVILGFSFSTVNGATVSWAAQHLPGNNYILSLIMIGRCLGLLLIPTAVTAMLKIRGPQVLLHAVFTSVIMMLGTLLLAQTLSVRYGINGKLHSKDYVEKSENTQQS